MGTTTYLGRVGLVLRGEYDAAVTYTRLDVVNYQGSSYAARGKTVGNPPTNPEYWQPVADVSAAVAKANAAADRVNLAIADVYDTVKDAAPAIVESASGEIIGVSDSAQKPLHGLKVFGKTTQNGTPSLDAPVPLVSVGSGGNIAVNVCGKNLLNCPEELTFTQMHHIERYISAGEYIVSCTKMETEGTSPVCIAFYMKNGEVVWTELKGGMDFPITLPEEAYNIRLYSNGYNYDGSEGITGTVEGLMLRPASVTDSAYELYKPDQSLTLSAPNGLPGIPVYGGGNYTDESGQQWICDEIDLARGVYVQRIDIQNLSDMTWHPSGTNNANTGAIYYVIFDDKYKHSISGMTTHFKEVNRQQLWENMAVGECIWIDHFVICAEQRTIGDFIAWLAEIKAVGMFVFANPVETPLDSETIAAFAAMYANKPNTTAINNASAHMQLDYAADTRLYIDNKFAQLAAALVNNA